MKEYSYSQAIEFFKNMPHFVPPKEGGAKKDYFSLDGELKLLEKLGRPQDKLKYVHIAGTNGKGSTTAYLASILNEASVVTGAFTSPFLYRYNEMFRVNGQDISDEDFAKVFSQVKPSYDELVSEGVAVSEYEFLTVMAFVYFSEIECEIVLMEVSMGGRMDTTNVIPAPLVTIITPISYDHMTILGNTLTEIATEKAGIIKPGTTVITASQENEVALVLEDTCKKNLVEIYSGGSSELISRSLKGQTFRVGERMYETSMLGIYQLQNAAVAIRAAEELIKLGYSISDDAIKNGIKNTKWFGRFTLVQDKPPIIVDGGHNRQGAAVLRQSLEAYFPGKKITFVLGILADKEVDIILDTLLPIADKCYTMPVPSPRTMDPGILAEKIRSRGVEAVVLENGANISSLVDADSVICVCGSLYLLQNVIY